MSADMGDPDFGGGFDEETFGDVGRTQIAAAPTEDSLNPVSMLRLVANYLADRLPADPGSVSNCAFVQSPYLERDIPLVDGDPKRHHVLARSKVYVPFGRVHLMAAGLSEGVSTAVDCDDPEELFDWLDARGLLDRPTVWVEIANHQLVWYPHGMGDEASSNTFNVGTASGITEADIEEALRIFYEKVAMVPRTDPSFWHDARLHVPCRDTEKVIQKALSIALDVHFHRDVVLREVPLRGSKIDFMIHQVKSGSPQPICALELKVIREKHHGEVAASARSCAKRTNTIAVNSGIDQAAIARDALGARFAYMAAYDMRVADDDTIMVKSKPKADGARVSCHRYFMYHSAAAYRAAVAAKTASIVAKRPPARRP